MDKEPEKETDSQGQPNPAVDLERKNNEEAAKRAEEKERAEKEAEPKAGKTAGKKA